ncbi:MAG: hypothetical protein CMM61_12925 [Rhodospirillaceae bacterium]|nr:hypothetical protein [Rhodospirillaceae bacterium]
MDYTQPLGAAPGTSYTNGNPDLAEEGSDIPAAGLENPQREIVYVITDAGLTPDNGDLTQLNQAIDLKIKAAREQIIYEGVTFAAGVVDKNAVRWDADNSEYALAVADGTENNQMRGFADVTNSRVYAFGPTPDGFFAGLTPETTYYLSGDTPGAITDTPPDDAVRVGDSLSATRMAVDVDTGAGGGGAAGAGEGFVYINGGATLALDGDAAPNVHMLLDANATVVPSNVAEADQVYSFYIMVTQDGTGGRTLTLPAGTEWPYGEVPTFPTSAGDVAKLTLETWDNGTTWHASWVGAEYA